MVLCWRIINFMLKELHPWSQLCWQRVVAKKKRQFLCGIDERRRLVLLSSCSCSISDSESTTFTKSTSCRTIQTTIRNRLSGVDSFEPVGTWCLAICVVDFCQRVCNSKNINKIEIPIWLRGHLINLRTGQIIWCRRIAARYLNQNEYVFPFRAAWQQ